MTGPKPSVKYWDFRKGYMCKFRGKQYLLCSGPDDGPTGPTYLKALDEFTKLLKAEERRTSNTLSVREVLERYLKFISTKKKPGTVEIRQRSFEPFVDHRPNGKCIAYPTEGNACGVAFAPCQTASGKSTITRASTPRRAAPLSVSTATSVVRLRSALDRISLATP